MTLLLLLVIGGFVLYVMSPAERARLGGAALGGVARLKEATTQNPSAREPFHDALDARTRWPFVTPVLVALNVTIFFLMVSAPGAVGDAETLVSWGGNFGPRTTNGEWWRLATTMFAHGGMFHLLVNMAGFVRVGLILERLVGNLAFATVYLTAGILASVASLSTDPVGVSVGTSGAIFGIYGLLVASVIWGMLHPSILTIPAKTLKQLAPAAAVFILYNVVFEGFESDQITGLVTGFAYGMVLAREVRERKPPARLLATVLATTVVIAVAAAAPLRGVADVRPELERILALEDRTARAYEKAVDQFRLGAITAKALAQVIDRMILPDLQVARARLKAIDGVPTQHQALVASAEEYLRLRDESWRLRSDALHKANMPALRKADRTEWASLDALQRIRPDDGK